MARLGRIVRKYKLDARFVFVVGGILVIGLLYGFNYIVQRQAHETAANAATIASNLVNQKHDDDQAAAAKRAAIATHTKIVANHKLDLERCKRNNGLRMLISGISENLEDLERSLALSRQGAAKIEATDELSAHDLASAQHYLTLARSLTPPAQLQCALVYPDPFPKPHHH